jgi:hypothetical protein
LSSLHSDDPWNWTAADSPEWIANFKRQHGIAPAEPIQSPITSATIDNWASLSQPNSSGGVISHNTLTQPIAPVPRSAAEMVGSVMAPNSMMLEGLPDMNDDSAALQEMDFGFVTELQGFGAAT